jgi:hypothetical protein
VEKEDNTPAEGVDNKVLKEVAYYSCALSQHAHMPTETLPIPKDALKTSFTVLKKDFMPLEGTMMISFSLR